jgi:hypothetical protein
MASPNSSSTPVFVGGGSPVVVGDKTTSLEGFYGTTPIVRRSGSAQAVNSLTSITSTVTFGFATSAGANALIAQVAEIAATLTALGLWTGS